MPPIDSSNRVRLVDIALKAGVSAAVVSAVLREGAGGSTTRVGLKTAQRVRKVAQEMGYRPNTAAQQLRGRKSDLIGVLIGADSTAANFRRLAAIEQAAHRLGRRLMIGQFHGEPTNTRSYLLDFLSRGIDSLICFHNPAPRYDQELIDLFTQFKASVFQTLCPTEQACCVDVDRVLGVRLAVDHLRERGKKRIGLILNDHPSNDPLMADRFVGWQQGLKEAGIAAAKDWMWHGDGTFPPSPALIEKACAFIAQSGVDAVVASNDVWAILVMKCLRRSGVRIPQDVAMVGFDNLDAAALADPALTTIDQNNADFAAAAIQLATAAVAGPQDATPQRTIVVEPRLIIREST